VKNHEIRATFDRKTITVYQAYGDEIAKKAIENNSFSSPFSFNRMTWIKPSFLWMMERSQWGKRRNQNNILAIKIKREFWEELLSIAILTDPEDSVYSTGKDWQNQFNKAKVHIQWDPERSIRGKKLEYRTIQVGISRHLIEEYNKNGIVEISDFTPLAKKILKLKQMGKHKEASNFLPKEITYPISSIIEKRLGIKR